jgi:hypothetical protein
MSVQPSRTPGWFILAVAVMMLPLLAWPGIIADMFSGSTQPSEGSSSLVLFFPIYALLSGWLAYRCYSTRRELSIILLAVLLLSYAAMAFLLNCNPKF